MPRRADGGLAAACAVPLPRRWTLARWLVLLAATLSCVVGPAVAADDDISAAEQAVFLDDHLKGLPDNAQLRYRFHRAEASLPDLDDEVTVAVRSQGERGRVATAEFLHGEHQLTLPEVEHASANPVILYFLENDVRGMNKRLGGSASYFRKRIRMALANAAVIDAVDVAYRGARYKGTRVVFTPYSEDPLKDRLQGMEGKRYEITLSDGVPGGVYELRTIVAGPRPGAPVRIEEILTLSGEGS